MKVYMINYSSRRSPSTAAQLRLDTAPPPPTSRIDWRVRRRGDRFDGSTVKPQNGVVLVLRVKSETR